MLFRVECFSLFIYVALKYLFDSILNLVVVDKFQNNLSPNINYEQNLAMLLCMMSSEKTLYQSYLHDLIESIYTNIYFSHSG